MLLYKLITAYVATYCSVEVVKVLYYLMQKY